MLVPHLAPFYSINSHILIHFCIWYKGSNFILLHMDIQFPKYYFLKTALRSNQSIIKEISPECSLEGLMLKLKLQYFDHPVQRAELTHLKRPWCWERLRAGGEGDHRGDGWMASPTQWTWVWVDSRSSWWIGRPGMLWFMGSQGVGHDWATELNWTFPVDWLFSAFLLKIIWLHMEEFISGLSILFHWSVCLSYCHYHTSWR